MFHRTPRSAAGFLLFWVVTSSIAAGQIPGVDVFPDSETDVACDLVNAANAELVVLTDTGELVLVSAEDIILDDTFVDRDSAVFIDDEPFGSLRFAEDADGLATLWWLAANGRVMHIDGVTFEVTASDLLPADISGTECDACNGFWDVQSDCAAPEPQPPPDDPSPGGVTIFQLCGSGFGMLMMGVTLFGLVGMRAAGIRAGLSPTRSVQ